MRRRAAIDQIIRSDELNSATILIVPSEPHTLVMNRHLVSLNSRQLHLLCSFYLRFSNELVRRSAAERGVRRLERSSDVSVLNGPFAELIFSILMWGTRN